MSDTPRGSESSSSPFARPAASGGNPYRTASSGEGNAPRVPSSSTGRFSAPGAVTSAARAQQATPAVPAARPAPGPTRRGAEAVPAPETRPVEPRANQARATETRAASASSASRPAAVPAVHRTRKARLRLSRIDPWSVMKTSFLFSIAFGILLVVMVWVLWGVLASSGTFESINRAVNDLLATPNSSSTFDLGRYLTGDRVIGFTALIAAADVVIFTALATLFSFLYNLSATVLGGLEVTLAED